MAESTVSIEPSSSGETADEKLSEHEKRIQRQTLEYKKMKQLLKKVGPYKVPVIDDFQMKFIVRITSQLNITIAPMERCLYQDARTLIYEGDVDYKDLEDEISNVHIFLLTDLMMIAKKEPEGSRYQYRLIRPKYMIYKMVIVPKFSKTNPEQLIALICLVLDDYGTSEQCFRIAEREGAKTMKNWFWKIREAKYTYDMSTWVAKRPSNDITKAETDYTPSSLIKEVEDPLRCSFTEMRVRRAAQERVTTMLYRKGANDPDDDSDEEYFLRGRNTASGFNNPLRHYPYNLLPLASASQRASRFQYDEGNPSNEEVMVPAPSKILDVEKENSQ